MGKIGIVGDLHFGKHNNDEKYLAFQKEWFETEFYESLEAENCKTVFFLGDIFESRTSLNPLILNTSRILFKNLTKNAYKYVLRNS